MQTEAHQKTVGIYRTVYPFASEAFITEQARHLKTYSPLLLMRDRRDSVHFEYEALSDRDWSGLKRKIFTLTRTTRFFEAHVGRRVSLVHAHHVQDGVYGAALARAWEVPLVVTCHGSDVATSLGALLRSKRPTVYQYLLRKRELLRLASRFIAVSQFMVGKLLEAGFPREKIVQHYIGVDTDRFAPAKAEGGRKQRYVLCVGRHVEKKGIPTLLRAFARVADRHDDVVLIQIGAGPQTVELENLVHRLGIVGKVRLLGSMPHEQVLAFMKSAEVFSLTSETAVDGDVEALGIVFNEASACGIPVVSTFSGGIPEAVLHGETGLLAEERDDQTVAEHLDTLLSAPDRARAMGRRGREYMIERFDIRRQTSQLEKIYSELCD